MLVFLLIVGPGADPVARQVGHHADPGHAAHARWRCGPTASTWTTWRRPGTASTSTATSSTRWPSRPARGWSRSSSRPPAGYALSVLRPRLRARSSPALVLATLFVPAVVLLVPLYLTILDPPLLPPVAHQQLLGGLAAGRRERLQRASSSSASSTTCRARSSRRPGWMARARSGCSGRSCCRCRGRSWAWSRCSRSSRPGRTTCGRCWCCPTRPSSRCRCACRTSSVRSSWTCSWPRSRSRRSSPSRSSCVLQRVFLRGSGLGGAIKG